MENINIDYKELVKCPLWWQQAGLIKYPHGGRKIETEYKLKHNGRLKRVYACQISNAGIIYIISRGKHINIDVNY